jgi:hypothetical protein
LDIHHLDSHHDPFSPTVASADRSVRRLWGDGALNCGVARPRARRSGCHRQSGVDCGDDDGRAAARRASGTSAVGRRRLLLLVLRQCCDRSLHRGPSLLVSIFLPWHLRSEPSLVVTSTGRRSFGGPGSTVVGPFALVDGSLVPGPQCHRRAGFRSEGLQRQREDLSR